MTLRPSHTVPDSRQRTSAPPGRRRGGQLGLLAVLAVAALGTPAFGEFDETHKFDSDSLAVSNLIGRIEIGPAAGDDFEVEVSVRGADGVPANIEIETRRGSRAQLQIVFPIEDERRFVYSEFSRRRAHLWSRERGSGSLLGEILRAVSGRRIRVERSGSGMEAWADLTIRVPEGRSLKVELGAGDIDVSRVAADLDLYTSAGSGAAAGLSGDVKIGVGSGGIEVSDVRGRLVLKTGSGKASLDGFEGTALSIDTGSGSVAVTEVAADIVDIDTGSGGVTVDGVEAEKLVIDTGSGRVSVESAECDAAVIDTGSGSVHLALERMGSGRFLVDTGSGGIVMLVPDDLSARFDIDIGSGGIDVDVPITKTLHKSRGEMRFVAGDGAATVVLDTGSGSVRVASVH